MAGVSSDAGDVKPPTEVAREPEETAEPPAVEAPLPPRRVAVLAIVAPLALALDIITKTLMVANQEGRDPIRILGGLIYLDVIRNPGAAFSMATGMTWVLSLIAVAVVVALIVVAPKLRSTGWAIGLGLVLAGALGNLLDRIFRSPGVLRGHVVDFVSVFGPYGKYFAVFNVADSCICVGGALIVLMAILGRDYDGGIGRRRRLAEASRS